MSSHRSFRPSTLAIHAVAPRDSHANSILSVDALEQTISALEGTPATLCFRSGMAAITTLCLSLLKSGDHVIVSEVVYGGTIRLFRQVLSGLGIQYSFVDTSIPAEVNSAKPSTKLSPIPNPPSPSRRAEFCKPKP